MRRLFLALWPDTATRKQLQIINAQLNVSAMRPVLPCNLHVTLVFIGSVDAKLQTDIEQVCDGLNAGPFTMQFNQLEYWPKPRILCLTSNNPPRTVSALAGELSARIKSLGVTTDRRVYQPHITLARHANGRQALEFAPLFWYADAFCLVESLSTTQGVLYKVITRWPFS